jgi:hypothetical protein
LFSGRELCGENMLDFICGHPSVKHVHF